MKKTIYPRHVEAVMREALEYSPVVLIYDGDSVLSFGKDMYALPLNFLWEEQA